MFSTTGATLTVYAAKHKKMVYILSSIYRVVETEATTEKKPNTITTYNITKCGVDIMEKMVRVQCEQEQGTLQLYMSSCCVLQYDGHGSAECACTFSNMHRPAGETDRLPGGACQGVGSHSCG